MSDLDRQFAVEGVEASAYDQVKLDEYINLAGELVIARNTLAHVFSALQGERSNHARPLKTAIEGVDRIAGAIQENAMAMRTVAV